MARAANEASNRISLRVRPEDKATMIRAAALSRQDLTTFVVQNVLAAAQTIIDEAERVELSARDSQRILDLLEHPPAPTGRLRRAARALPRQP